MFYRPNVVGAGQGVYRLMQFSSAIANDNGERLTFEHWAQVVNEYFSPQANWKLTLWKDNERREAKLFEIVPDVIAMLLLVSSQSGVRSMNFVLDGARERSYTLGTSVIDCPNAQWVWRFYDGHVITLRGAFTCQISAYNIPSDGLPYTLKIDSMTFDALSYERMITLDAIRGTRGVENIQKTPATTTQGSPDNASSTSINTVKSEESNDRPMSETDSRSIVIEHAVLPPDPINAFGIPQASMRCLEVS
ncbi:LIM-domain binding protein [Hysterangium stoloniferum]|nr:LIM-domain binding protein [Hysterangium stoloniferum]